MNDIGKYLINYRKSSDKIWFEKIYYHYLLKIYNFFYFKTMDEQISEDLTSEVFLKTYKNLGDKEFNSKSFNVWIYKIASNQLIDYFRKTKTDRERTFLTDWQEQDNIRDSSLLENDFFIKNSMLMKKELSFENHKLVEAMCKLTTLQKNIVILIFVMDFDYKTIANILGKSQSTIRGILFRAINILKSEIKNV
ncbi:MAG: sigma-70 family RNA polymerase sigma factor [Actinobacteria bacterium]|nr:sigma-70 family RNA polymerase sigma factor [Actinomycetota bacterium]